MPSAARRSSIGCAPGRSTLHGGTLQLGGGQLVGAPVFWDGFDVLRELQGGAAGSGFDQVNVAGSALLDGDLLLQFGAGFAPQVGQRVELMTWQQHSGQFEGVGISGLDTALRAQLSCGANGLSLTVSAAPEPGPWSLLLAGGVCPAALARRRAAA